MPKVTKNLRDTVMSVKDNAASNQIWLALEEGNLTFETFNNVVEVLDRGDLSHMRQGDEQPCTLSFGTKFIEFIQQAGAADETLYEAITNTGAAAAWVSSNSDGGDVYTVDIDFLIISPTSGESNELVAFTKVRGQFSFAEGDEYNTLSFEGTAFIVRPAITKTAATS